MEYIGEVIPNHEFIKRTKEYEAAGLEHYYFMTLKTDEVSFDHVLLWGLFLTKSIF
jgi:hypothetical protein